MQSYPHPETPFARAIWCVKHRRSHEMQLEGLTVEELGTVRAELVRQMFHARARQVKNRVTEAILAVAFVAIGVFLMMVGPLEMMGNGPGLMIYNQALLYGLLIVFIVFAGVGADYVLRRRNKRARGIARAIEDVRSTIERIDAAV